MQMSTFKLKLKWQAICTESGLLVMQTTGSDSDCDLNDEKLKVP